MKYSIKFSNKMINDRYISYLKNKTIFFSDLLLKIIVNPLNLNKE
jgi:hypothetical protein